MVGEWEVRQGGRTASSSLKINATHGYMCGDSVGMAYSIVPLINGSYPSFKSRITREEPCPDVTIMEDLVNSAFLLVSGNLTQVVMHNYRGKVLLVLDLIKGVSANAKIAAERSPPRPPVNPVSNQNINTSGQSNAGTQTVTNQDTRTTGAPSTSTNNLQGATTQDKS